MAAVLALKGVLGRCQGHGRRPGIRGSRGATHRLRSPRSPAGSRRRRTRRFGRADARVVPGSGGACRRPLHHVSAVLVCRHPGIGRSAREWRRPASRRRRSPAASSWSGRPPQACMTCSPCHSARAPGCRGRSSTLPRSTRCCPDATCARSARGRPLLVVVLVRARADVHVRALPRGSASIIVASSRRRGCVRPLRGDLGSPGGADDCDAGGVRRRGLPLLRRGPGEASGEAAFLALPLARRLRAAPRQPFAGRTRRTPPGHDRALLGRPRIHRAHREAATPKRSSINSTNTSRGWWTSSSPTAARSTSSSATW